MDPQQSHATRGVENQKCFLLSNMVLFVIVYRKPIENHRIHVYSVCILHVFCPYPALFLRIRRIHRIHVSDAYPTCIRCIHLYPPSRPKYARICPRIRTVDSHSVGRKRGFVSIFVFFAEYIVNTRCIHTYLDVFRRNIRE